MATKQQFTAITWQEDNGWAAQALEADVANQGETREEALANLEKALELYFETEALKQYSQEEEEKLAWEQVQAIYMSSGRQNQQALELLKKWLTEPTGLG